MNNLFHFPLSTTIKDQAQFNFTSGLDWSNATKKKVLGSKIVGNVDSNRSSKKKINSARHESNSSAN